MSEHKGSKPPQPLEDSSLPSQNSDRFRHFIEHASDAFFLHDYEGRLLDVNQQACASLGYDRLELLRMTVFDIEQDLDLQRAQTTWGRLKRGNAETFSGHHRRKDGTIFPVEARITACEVAGEPRTYVAFIRDMTEHERAERIMKSRIRLLEFSLSYSLAELLVATLDEAEVLTGSQVGFFHFIDRDQRTLSLQAWSTRTTQHMCQADASLRHYDLKEAGVWADCISRRQPIIHNDYATLQHRKGLPTGHAVVTRELVVPIFRGNLVVAILGLGNKAQDYDNDDIETITRLADLAWDIAERKRTEEDLRASEGKLRTMFDHSLDAMLLTYPDGRIKVANPAACAMFGMTQEELCEMGRQGLMDPDDDRFAAAAEERERTGKVKAELSFRRKDGTKFLADVSSVVLENPLRSFVVMRDVTERDLAQKRLRQNEAQMHAILNSAMDGIITVDSNQRIVLFNSAAEELLGYTAQEMLGTSIDRLVPAPLRSKHASRFADFSGSGRRSMFGTIAAERSDGKLIPIEASLSRVEVSGQDLFTIILRDVSERKMAEERQQQFESAITKAASEWRLTFDAVTSAILVLDVDGKIRRLNRAAKELMMAQRYEDAIGHPILDLAGSEPWLGVAKLVPLAIEGRTPVSCQVREERGRTWDVSARVAANEETEDRVVIVVRDVTQLISLQMSLRSSEAMASMGALVAGVAHEVRNPLFGISSTIDTFEACFGDRDEFREYVSILRGEVQRLRKLMQELLEYGKPLNSELSPGSLNQVIEAAIRACHLNARQSEVSVKFVPSEVLPPVNMDPSRLLLLFRNLVENAIQHSPNGGEVLVTTQLSANDSAVECSVADSGPGFRESDLSRIFDPFFSRRQGGTGLGLSIVQRVAEEHRGKVSAETRDGRGALIRVILPSVQSGSN
jgi:PAS domain S-box-containing protein